MRLRYKLSRLFVNAYNRFMSFTFLYFTYCHFFFLSFLFFFFFFFSFFIILLFSLLLSLTLLYVYTEYIWVSYSFSSLTNCSNVVGRRSVCHSVAKRLYCHEIYGFARHASLLHFNRVQVDIFVSFSINCHVHYHHFSYNNIIHIHIKNTYIKLNYITIINIII